MKGLQPPRPRTSLPPSGSGSKVGDDEMKTPQHAEAEILGLVPVFPVRNTTTFTSGANESANKAVFRDCVLVKKNSTVADVARKIMGDAPIAYVEGAGGIRVAEDQIVTVGKNDVGNLSATIPKDFTDLYTDPIIQGRPSINSQKRQVAQLTNLAN